MTKLLLVIFGLVIGVSGVGFLFGIMNKEDLPTTSSLPVSTASTEAALDSTISNWNKCQNSAQSYLIYYPLDWTTTLSGDEACNQFSPTPDTGVSVKINTTLKSTDYLSLKTSLETSDETKLLLNKKTLEVSGEQALQIETEATGIGTDAKGTRAIYYFIERTSQPVVVSYTETEVPEERENYLGVLELMVSNLSLAN